KRSRETHEAQASADVKKAKKVKKRGGGGGGGEEAETKKAYSQRVWTDDDEIVVLEGLIDYKNDIGVSSYDDTNRVYQLVKKTI
ncbi:DUF573 domain-containing protein, partial [Vibrio sp. Vb2424]